MCVCAHILWEIERWRDSRSAYMYGDCWSQDRGQALFIFLVFDMSNQGIDWVQPLTRGRDFAESRGCWRPEFAQKLLLLIPFSAEGIEVRFVKGAQSTWEYLQCSEHWPQVCRLFLLIRGWFYLPNLILSYHQCGLDEGISLNLWQKVSYLTG